MTSRSQRVDGECRLRGVSSPWNRSVPEILNIWAIMFGEWTDGWMDRNGVSIDGLLTYTGHG